MANKKRKKKVVGTRPGAVAVGSSTSPRGRSTDDVRPAASAGSETPTAAAGKRGTTTPEATTASTTALNRQARKEEARRQREALRRKMARRRYYRVGGAVLVSLAVVAGGIVWAMTRPDHAAAAGCGPIENVGPYQPETEDTGGGAHTKGEQRPAFTTYPSQPPTSGPHVGATVASGTYDTPPDMYQVLHSLEHGAVAIWYRADTADPGALDELLTYYNDPQNNDHVIVAPYDYPDQGEAGQLPEGQDMVMTAWHHTQACERISLDVAKGFANTFRCPTGGVEPARSEAPEACAGI